MLCPERDNTDRSNKSNRSYNSESAQALIVILLVSAVGLTIGLSLASRTTKDTNITTEIEESTRAFSAAEAGLEESAQHIGDLSFSRTNQPVGNATYDVEIKKAGGTTEPYQFPGEISNNQLISVWLVGHNGDEIDWNDKYNPEQLRICWGVDELADTALEMTLLYRSGDPQVKRQVFNPNGKEIVENAVEAVEASLGDCGGDYSNFVDLNFKNDMEPVGREPMEEEAKTKVFLRLRPIMEDGSGKTRIAVEPVGDELPTQGEEHISTGTTDSGQTTRLVQFISHPVPPEIFDFVLYSRDGNISK